MTIRPLSPFEVAGEYAKSVAVSTARLAIKRIRRTSDQVAAEYDGGRWSAVATARSWEKAASLEAFLVQSSAQRMVAIVDGCICELTETEYLRYRLNALGRLVEGMLGTDHDVVELGCGYGYNLFALSLRFPNRRFTGLDISPTGVATARTIAAHFGLQDRIEFDAIDLTDARDPNFRRLRGKAALTFFCLEQLPQHIDAVLRSIANEQPWRVLHIEPASELLSPLRPVDWANLLYVKSMHYQTSLLAGLERLRKSGEIELIGMNRLAFAPTIQQLGVTAVWARNAVACRPRPLVAEPAKGAAFSVDGMTGKNTRSR